MSASLTASDPLPFATARHAAAPRAARRGTRRLVCLDVGDLVRIVDGLGILVHARSGVLWITDEHSRDDVVLRAGELHRVGRAGVTIVEAHRVTRLVIEVPHGCAAPCAIEMMLNGGRRARPIPLGGTRPTPWPIRLARRILGALAAPRLPPLPQASYPELRRPRASSRHDPAHYTPEAVRDRLSGAHLHPYF